MVSSARSAALPREPEQQSNRDAEPNGSPHKPSANIETDSSHHQETNRDKNSGKLRVHLHHAHNARVAISITALHLVNCLTGTGGRPGLLISLAQITPGVPHPSFFECRILRSIRRALHSREARSTEYPLVVREKIYILALLAAIGVFHAATVRQGHIWSDDFAMYVHHAQNIVEGRPYAETGYIYNPSFPVYGPRFYPPTYPLLLAPIYGIFGLNLIPMKLEQVLFLVLALIAIYAHWKRDLGPGYTLALVALLGFNPEFWVAKDNVLSDIPFLFFFYLTALLVRNARRDSAGWRRWSAVIGLVTYLAISTRNVGVALGAGLLLYDVLRLRTITRFTAVSIMVCAGFLVLQPHIVGVGPGGYLYELPRCTRLLPISPPIRVCWRHSG